jgi:exosortase/archaeosortase family protein
MVEDRRARREDERRSISAEPKCITIPRMTHAGAWLRVARFCTGFLLLIALYAATFQSPFVMRWVHEPMSRLVALICVPALSLVGEVTLSGTHLTFNGFRAVIVEACNGVLPTYIFLAAVLAFPSSWRDKLSGVLLGVPVIFIINVARVISLMILGAYKPDIVERVHIDVWQTAVVALAMATWIFWAERFARRRPAIRS